jgi:hypothetical protein
MVAQAEFGLPSWRTRLSQRAQRTRSASALVPGRGALQICLGLLWLLDAGLQYQPFMFGPFFVTQVIQPATAGTPAIVASSVTWASEVMLRHIALYNALFATIQLLIALGILVPRSRKAALAASVIWALSVWWFGESLGGIFTGASPLAGLPGGVLLYAVIAVLIWPTTRIQPGKSASPAMAGAFGPKGARIFWLALWGSFSYFILLPANRSPSAIGQMLSVTAGQPGWLTVLMDDLSSLAGQQGLAISAGLAALCALAGAGILVPRLARPAVGTAALVALLIWIAEGLGGIFTGQGTDPNSGLPLLLLAACYWPWSRPGTADLTTASP